MPAWVRCAHGRLWELPALPAHVLGPDCAAIRIASWLVAPTLCACARSKPSHRNCYDALIGVLLTTPKTAHSSPTATTAATLWTPRAALVLLPDAF